MKRSLVTGAGGFVGSALVRRLLDLGVDVHAVLRPGSKIWRLEGIRKHLHLHVADIANDGEIDRILSSVKPDWIFHLAAHGAYPTQTDTRQILQTNVVATASLVNAALKTGFEAFVNAGSSSEYGFKDHPPSEAERLEPNSDYAVSKAAGTLFCTHVGIKTGENIVTLRLYSVYGPWEEPRRLIPTLAIRALDGRLPKLASPTTARDYVFIDDVVEAFLLAASNSRPEAGAIYNIGTGIQLSLADVVEIARKELDIKALPEWGSMGDRTWDTRVWVSDSTRGRQVLGWRPSYSFRDGFSRFVEWVRSDDSRAAYYRANAAE